MPPIPTVDDMFPIGSDMVVNLGKDSTQLNLIILSPKTEKRASGEEVSLSRIDIGLLSFYILHLVR